MGKGSQLTQLKSALSKAGITGQQGKKRKRAAPLEKDKEKRAAQIDEIHRQLLLTPKAPISRRQNNRIEPGRPEFSFQVLQGDHA